MDDRECSHELSRETVRARGVRGGTTKCSRCDKPRVESSAYCREHRAAYQRDWRRARHAEFLRLKKIAESAADPTCAFAKTGP